MALFNVMRIARRSGVPRSELSDPPEPTGDAVGGSHALPARSPGQLRLWRLGRSSWSVAGILVLVAVVGVVLGQIPLVVVPVLLALFPVSLVAPVKSLLERWMPSALAAIITILAGIALLAGALTVVVTLVVAQVPELAESAEEGLEQIEEFLEADPMGLGLPALGDLVDMVGDQLGELGEIAPQAVSAAVVAFEFVAGMLILLVVVFFYLKDGPRLANGLLSVVPRGSRERVRVIGSRAWETLGAFFRGQMLVALVDAVVIGIGLLILGVPLALPLAVLIFFGGLFPIVGAVATGALAVLVALADGGLVLGLIVLGIVLAVQQLESNVLEPIILARAIDLHPLVVLLSITAGAVTLGILGAFLAVPVAAVVAVVVDELRGDDDANDPQDGEQGADEPGAGEPRAEPSPDGEPQDQH